jgi:hypothetical protein
VRYWRPDDIICRHSLTRFVIIAARGRVSKFEIAMQIPRGGLPERDACPRILCLMEDPNVSEKRRIRVHAPEAAREMVERGKVAELTDFTGRPVP